MQLNLEDLNLGSPFYRMSSDFDNIEKCNSIKKMLICNELALKSNMAIGYYIISNKKNVYQIKERRDMGLIHKRNFYDFIFRNPMHKVEIFVEEIESSIVLEKFEYLLKLLGNEDFYSIEHES